ncbi:MAG: hypothetical protein AAF725_19950 [Acidobacteriota bacterium]
MRSWVVLLIALSASAVPALAQPSETCTSADLGISDTFPIGGFTPVADDDFAMTGTGCSEEGSDLAVCFTPTDDCTVTILCGIDTGTSAVNVFDGPCSSSPAACSASQSGSPGEISSVALVGGQNTCVVCEFSDPGLAEFSVVATAGDCGSLPVELMSFSVEGE